MKTFNEMNAIEKEEFKKEVRCHFTLQDIKFKELLQQISLRKNHINEMKKMWEVKIK